ncbi:DUF305 domain-containing protein [Actinoplanes sp. KI2]|uniref:DUF305 domain-containing protein n=1 Tax=Actinoplanes sp. KI2 TaxID=2983315 RepID=UPI0021D58B23|nr:DUF305 domain-containing protein [Actinoplanes sp. KI2]MCU7727280.1 DUF305 domain-containing protein [Actinoplanes sp. KI2]
MARHLIRLALILALVAGCSPERPAVSAAPPTTTTDGAVSATSPFNATDVMFLQMGLAQIAEGDQVAQLAAQRAGDARIRAVATELRTQWRDESGPMQRWLLGWQQPLAADPSAGAHAGHGALHALRAADLQDLRSASGSDFDRTAVSLLLGQLANCVETSRMEESGGAYPPARSLAATVTQRRQSQIQRLLTLAAGQ